MTPSDDLAPGEATTLDRDLGAEMRTCAAVPQKSIDAFLAAGVSPGALAFDADGFLNPLCMARIVFGFMGRFEFVRHIRQPLENEIASAFVWLCRDLDGKPADIVAWNPKRDRAALWLGTVPMLGMEQAGPWYDMAGDTLPVHRDASDWLRADRRGVVIFDHRAAAPWLHLTRPLLVPTPVDGAVLREKLTIPAPKIVVGEVRA